MSEKSNISKSMLRAGDVITVRTGYSGTTCVVPQQFDRSNAVDIIITRLKDTILPEFFSVWVNPEHGKGQVLSGQGGLAQPHVHVGEMKKLLLSNITLDKQKAIIDIIVSLFHSIQDELFTLNKVKIIKQGLAQDLLTGKVSIA